MAFAERVLLCASARHLAHVLHAAAQQRLPLHQVQLSTQWPEISNISPHSAPPLYILWALLPGDAPATELQQEWAWRAQLPSLPPHWNLQMLYGDANQQAQQLLPWTPCPNRATDHTVNTEPRACEDCLDPSSEQRLLLQRRWQQQS